MALPVRSGRRRLAGKTHNAAHGLGNDIVAGTLVKRAVAAKAGYSGIDDAGIDLLEHIVAHAQLIHDAGAIIFHHHVRIFHHFLKKLLALGLFQV